jgi:hypothetical protein
MRRCWIGYLVSFVLGSSYATDNLSFILICTQFKQVILAFFMSLFAFSNCFLVIKLDTIL